MTATPTSSAPAPPPPETSSAPTSPKKRTWTILGRLAQAVREQNWFAVALELVIVVLGVFLGVQLGNWNAARQERALSNEYLQRLADDLRSNVEILEKRVRGWQEDERNQEILVGYLEDGDLAERTPWEMAMRAYGEAGWSPFVPNRTTYDELQSTGQIRLIRDPDLRRAVSGYYAYIEQFELFYVFDTPLREQVRGTFPMHVQRYVWNVCFSDKVWRAIGEGLTDCPPFEDPETVSATLAALRADPDLVRAIQYTNSIRLVAIQAAQTDLANSKALIARIEEAL